MPQIDPQTSHLLSESNEIAVPVSHEPYSPLLQVRGYEGNLTVRISEQTVGKYICRASVTGFTEITAAASVLGRN